MNWDESRSKEIDVLFDCIEQKFSIKRELLFSMSRKNELVRARRILMNVLFETFKKDNMSHEDISQVVKRNRCSFIHHRSKHQEEYDCYKKYKQEYDFFKKDFIAKLLITALSL